MTRREYEGRSPAEAAIKACEELGVTRSALRYEVISESGQDITDRHVVIAVEVDETLAKRTEESAYEGQSDERPRARDRSARRGRGERGRHDRRGGPPRERDERRRGGRGGRSARGGRDERGRGRRGREKRAEANDVERMLELEPVPAESPAPRVEVQEELSSRAAFAKEVVSEIIRLAGFELEARIVEDGDEEIHIELQGADAARAIGTRGETLLALQFLVNRMVSRQEEGNQHLVLDAADYRNRRREALTALAKQLGDRALDERKVVRLSPMSAHDRRIFHVTLKDMEGVTTRSEGEGLYRPMLIIPTAD